MEFTNITKNLRHDVYPAIDPSSTLKGSCAGKNVLVTGSGRGIGKGIALSFALAGAKAVIITARTASELEAARADILAASPSTEVIVQVLDVASEQSVEGMFDALAARGITLDVLVNNAGYTDEMHLLGEGSPAAWWGVWEVNVKGQYLTTHYALKAHVAAASPERVLTILCNSSIGSMVTMPGLAPLQMTKTVSNRLADFIDAEYAAKGVRAFAFHPGAVPTHLDRIPAAIHHMFVDSTALSGGLCVWLATQKDAKLFSGRYLSANWDIEDIVAQAKTKSDVEMTRWLKTKVVV